MQKWKLLVKIVNYLKLVKEINVKYLLLKKKKITDSGQILWNFKINWN